MTSPNLAGLKPCPFCGGADRIIREHLEGTTLHPAFRIKCDNCGAQAGWSDQEREAEAWNTRAALRTVSDEPGAGAHPSHEDVAWSRCENFVSDWYRPSRCVNCGVRRKDHPAAPDPAIPADTQSREGEKP